MRQKRFYKPPKIALYPLESDRDLLELSDPTVTDNLPNLPSGYEREEPVDSDVEIEV